MSSSILMIIFSSCFSASYSWFGNGRSARGTTVPFIQDKRKAVSGVMARLPCTISLIRRGGILISLAKRYWLISIGRKNSSSKISPGWMASFHSQLFPMRENCRSNKFCVSLLTKLIILNNNGLALLASSVVTQFWADGVFVDASAGQLSGVAPPNRY